MAALDFLRRIAHGAGGVIEEALLLVGLHQAEEIAGLREVVAVLAVVPVVGHAFDGQRRLTVIRLFIPLAVAVGLVAEGGAVVAVDAHGAVAVVAVERALGRIDRNLVVIDAEPVERLGAVGTDHVLGQNQIGEIDFANLVQQLLVDRAQGCLQKVTAGLDWQVLL
ncbi:hypothetical protein SDC9_191355 [bioreactor metagenome]|uniref:Uncharacterized protein n=1 Tax=bioreactor metagenome TaxID=1076179 RepID=A0A645I5X0_9ZZZZ